MKITYWKGWWRMHISIDAQPRKGLKIIREIPDIPLCRIEGYNGIGKSSAINLIQLCCGEQPFRDQASAWRTFRNQLNSARVEITNIRGAESISWRLESSRWPTNPEDVGDLIGDIRVNGKTANISAVRELLEVHHIRADETLADMLTQHAHSSRRRLTSWLVSAGQRRQEVLDDTLKHIQDLIIAAAPSQFPLETQRAIELENEAGLLADHVERIRVRVELLKEAAGIHDKLDQVRGRGPELDAKLARLEAERNELAKRKAQLDKDITAASERQQRDTQAEKEFTLAQKQLVRQERKLTEASANLRAACSSLGVEPKAASIAEARKKAAQRLNDLVALQPQVHATPLLIKLLKSLIVPLEQAEFDELGDKTVISASTGPRDITVSALKDMLLGQLATYERDRPTTDAELLDRDIRAARGRLASIVALDSILSELAEAQSGRDRATERLRVATAALPPSKARTLNDLLTQRSDLDARAASMQEQYARLTQARELLGDGQTEEALLAELVRLSAAAGVEVSRVRSRLETDLIELEAMVARQKMAAEAASQARRQANEHRSRVASAIGVLSSNKYGWLRQVVPDLNTLTSVEPYIQAQTLEKISAATERARARLSGAVRSVQGITGALSNVLELLESGASPAGSWDNSVRLWLGEEVRRWFDNDQVRKALFAGGTSVHLDPLAMIVSWTTKDGVIETRPLSAFSSGQQAFAFTRARMAQLDREVPRAANRLIALDEFGSVIDGRRMAYLASYLNERRAEKPDDQVVVILPLRDGVLELSRREAPERIESLEEKGYFAEPLHLRTDVTLDGYSDTLWNSDSTD